MRGFLYCLLYTLALGWSAFFLGRLIPADAFDEKSFPFKEFSFERGLYRAIKVKKWQKYMPDMSRLFVKLMPEKRASFGADFALMIRETCVAEVVHAAQSLFGFVCLALWRGAGGIIVSVGYFFGNMAFVVIQRYNRPRLIAAMAVAARHPALVCAERAAESDEVDSAGEVSGVGRA